MEDEEARRQIEDAVKHVKAVGHGRVEIKIADHTIVNVSQEAQWELRRIKDNKIS